MFDQIQLQIAKLIDLNVEEMTYFKSLLTTKSLKRKEFLLQQGEICKFASFINKGCLRYFYLVDGEEHTGQFFFENGWYLDYESFLTGKPSKQNIEALEPTDLVVLSKIDLEKLYKEIPKFERFGRLMAENAFLGLKSRTEMLTNESAEERYLHLVESRPKVIERVSQHYIASYLGLQPQSLSRIRKRLSQKG